MRTQSGAVAALRHAAHRDRLAADPASRFPAPSLPGVVTFRDLDDVNAMLAAAEKGGNAVVIGGGLLGLEAAAGLAAQGHEDAPSCT